MHSTSPSIEQPAPRTPRRSRRARRAPLPVSVGIFGASGTTGVEVARLCHDHPVCRIAFATSRTHAGEPLRIVDPAAPKLRLVHPDDVELDAIDVAFVCLPHGRAAAVVARCADAGLRVIDLSGDLRLRDAELHRRVYGTERVQSIAERTVYGLTELHREAIGGASIVSNPGCYPTCAGMALMPLARVGALPDTLVIDAKSGISGAGRQPTATNHFCSVTNDVRPYNLGRAHRHTPEIEQSLAAMGRGAVASHPRVIFCPHVVPLERGMLVTVVLEVPQLTGAEVHALYVEHYADECFVEVLPISEPARIRAAALSNNVVIGITPVEDTRHVVVTCAIDNLLKGAAGQAVQNMNLMFDLPETAGLAPTQVGTWSHLVTPDSLEIQS